MKPYLAVFNVEMSYASKYPFKQGEVVLVLCEVSNMPGHLAVCRCDGSMSWGWHEENFRKLKVSET